jgi:hypothetical protein
MQGTNENQIITSEDDLEDELAGVWETVGGDLSESVFSEWMSRSEWVKEYKGEDYVNPY